MRRLLMTAALAAIAMFLFAGQAAATSSDRVGIQDDAWLERAEPSRLRCARVEVEEHLLDVHCQVSISAVEFLEAGVPVDTLTPRKVGAQVLDLNLHSRP
jgi:hypothetical protein